jgi:hypothetical protein
MDSKVNEVIKVFREDQARLEYPADTELKVREVQLDLLDSMDRKENVVSMVIRE